MAPFPVSVSVRGLGLRFGDERRVPSVLDRLDLDVAAGEFLCIVGPTGCGKSSLLNLLAGLALPSSGEILLNGVPLRGLNRQAGYLFQTDALLPWRNARDNVAAGLEFRGSRRSEARRVAEDWLARVGLAEAAHRYPHELSGGMKKRVALAQMLAIDPQLLLLDEPFSALDVQTRAAMENELLRLWSAERRTVVFITHDLEEAIALGDRVVVLSAGPGSHIVGDYQVTLPRPREVEEIRLTPAFIELRRQIWALLREQVQLSS